MKEPERLRIGIKGTSYVIERLVSGLPLERVKVVRRYDLLNVWNFIQQRILRDVRATSFANCFHCDLGLNDVHLFHFVNTLSCSPTPWIVTFEHDLPRWNPASQLGLYLLARPTCRKIIAISQFAYDELANSLQRSPHRDAILRKTTVIHPPQPLLVRTLHEKHIGPYPITFTFIGRDFFRKGGLEILRVFTRLQREQIPCHLNIVSAFAYGDYASRTTSRHLREAMSLIAGLGKRVTVYQEIPNARVLDLLRASHIGLLPTYHDTYGFSVLESQAAGCATMTTDVCALPEINNDKVGWVIPTPQLNTRTRSRFTDGELRELSDAIQKGLYAAIMDAVANPTLIAAKGAQAIARIAREHDPTAIAEQICTIYRRSYAPQPDVPSYEVNLGR